MVINAVLEIVGGLDNFLHIFFVRVARPVLQDSKRAQSPPQDQKLSPKVGINGKLFLELKTMDEDLLIAQGL
jgi:hypothetical protein